MNMCDASTYLMIRIMPSTFGDGGFNFFALTHQSKSSLFTNDTTVQMKY